MTHQDPTRCTIVAGNLPLDALLNGGQVQRYLERRLSRNWKLVRGQMGSYACRRPPRR